MPEWSSSAPTGLFTYDLRQVSNHECMLPNINQLAKSEDTQIRALSTRQDQMIRLSSLKRQSIRRFNSVSQRFVTSWRLSIE
jgi:hypothetical protein